MIIVLIINLRIIKDKARGKDRGIELFTYC